MRGNLSNDANTDKALSHILRHGLLAANVSLLKHGTAWLKSTAESIRVLAGHS